ncbi:MAG: toxic anion resistance protein [Nitrospinae bacterium]|nr:toxic anion resistance protein [Nitrospinota bacterium]
METETTGSSPTRLALMAPEDIKKELALVDPTSIHPEPGEDANLEESAKKFVSQLIAVNPQNAEAGEAGKTAVETMGFSVQREAANQSQMLKQPISALSKRADDGGDVANALINLKMTVDELNPNKFDMEPGWFGRALSKIPGVGSPLARYFTKYESSQSVIESIIQSLEQGKNQLQRDNVTLAEDQKQMRESNVKLERAIKLGQLIDQGLQYKLDREIPKEDPRHKFIGEELLFPLRQRLIDLQQQLAVSQQGVLATELIIRNNKELARGVDRAVNVTVTALQVAVTVALALANQKMVLDKISSVSQTTSDLIAGTAERLKTQGVEIHKQASTAQISMESLKKSFADIDSALKDISEFRMNALPQMASTVLELDKITAESGKAIELMEKSKKNAGDILIEAD